MNSSTEQHYYYYCCIQQQILPPWLIVGRRPLIGSCSMDMVSIILQLYKSSPTDGIYFEYVTESRFMVPFSDACPLRRPMISYKKMISGFLSSMLVHQDKHADIVEQICQGIYNVNVVPNLFIIVTILDFTLANKQLDDIPYKSSLEALREKYQILKTIRVDTLEEAIVETMPDCAICIEALDYFDEASTKQHEVVVVNHELTMITQFPCKHLYHRDCIRPWLEKSNVCPLCRYRLPQIKVMLKPSSKNVCSPEVLMKCSFSLAGGLIGGVIIGKILCKLLKRT